MPIATSFGIKITVKNLKHKNYETITYNDSG